MRTAGGDVKRLLARFNRTPFVEFVNRRHTNTVAEVSVVAALGPDVLPAADLVLHFDGKVLSLAATNATEVKALASASSILPLIAFEDVPLSMAIGNLARYEGLNYLVDSKVTATWQGPAGATSEPLVTFKWENVTARQVLIALLDRYGLRWIEDPQTGIARITLKQPTDASRCVAPEAGTRLLELTRNAMRQRLAMLSGPYADGSQGYTFLAGELPDTKPMCQD